jgi:DNA primase small subunit
LSKSPYSTAKIIKDLFREYYRRAELVIPEDFILREFAFQLFDSGSYIRHRSFQSHAALRDYLIKNTPRQAYYSCAIYRDPAADSMEDKGWLGSEIMFDIDADHIPGCIPQTLINVYGKEISIPTIKCIELAMKHEERLLNILQFDFGFSKDEIMVYFSGNRGFHTIVRPKDKEWLKLSSDDRREIIDYILGIGLDLSRLVPKIKSGIKIVEPSESDGGWRSRLAKAKVKVVSDDSFGIKADELIVKIDEQVTQDVSRLIRIPGSLNGKTGIPAMLLNTNDPSKFTFDINLLPFKGDALIIPKVNAREIDVLGYKLSASIGMPLKVPMGIAVYLALKEVCEILRVI